MQPEGSDAEGPGQVGLEVSLLMLTPEEATAGRMQASTVLTPPSSARGVEVKQKDAHNAVPGVVRGQVSSAGCTLQVPVVLYECRIL